METRALTSILLVDDDLDTVSVAEDFLRSHGYDVHVALSAADGLSLLKQGLHPDLIFTDVFMPGPMTGVAFIREALRRHPGIKVLLTSGFDAPFHFVKKPDVIEYPFLAKPYGGDQLIQSVKQVLLAKAC